MPSFDYQKKIWRISGRKKRKKIVGPYCSKCWNWEFWIYFFTEINVFVITQSKVPKKGTVGYRYWISVTDTGTVPVQMWTVPNPSNKTSWLTFTDAIRVKDLYIFDPAFTQVQRELTFRGLWSSDCCETAQHYYCFTTIFSLYTFFFNSKDTRLQKCILLPN